MAAQNTAGTVTVELVLDANKFDKGAKQSQKWVKDFTSTVKQRMIPTIKDLSQHLVFDLSGAFSSLVEQAKQFGREALELAKKAELTNKAFEVLVGNAEQAKGLLAEIEKFAQTTPLGLTELQDAARKLVAFNISIEETIPTLQRLGDISAGVGIKVDELADIYGKAAVQGRLFAEDINQLTGRGIPVIQEFAKQFGVADSEVKSLVESGVVGFKNLEDAFKSLTAEGGKFNDLLKEMGQTNAGEIEKLKQEIEKLKREVGEDLLPAELAFRRFQKAETDRLRFLVDPVKGIQRARAAGGRGLIEDIGAAAPKNLMQRRAETMDAQIAIIRKEIFAQQEKEEQRATENFTKNVMTAGKTFLDAVLMANREMTEFFRREMVRQAVDKGAIQTQLAMSRLNFGAQGLASRAGLGLGRLSNMIGAGIAPIANQFLPRGGGQQTGPGIANQGILRGSAQDIRLDNLRENQALFGEVADQGVQEQKQTNTLLERILNAVGGGGEQGEIGVN